MVLRGARFRLQPERVSTQGGPFHPAGLEGQRVPWLWAGQVGAGEFLRGGVLLPGGQLRERVRQQCRSIREILERSPHFNFFFRIQFLDRNKIFVF